MIRNSGINAMQVKNILTLTLIATSLLLGAGCKNTSQFQTVYTKYVNLPPCDQVDSLAVWTSAFSFPTEGKGVYPSFFEGDSCPPATVYDRLFMRMDSATGCKSDYYNISTSMAGRSPCSSGVFFVSKSSYEDCIDCWKRYYGCDSR